MNGFTHAGKFHADDVFSTALLQLVFPDFEYTRGFEVPEDFEGIVYDIGLGEFDHHQQDAEVRDNEMPYAAFGLLWREYGPDLLGQEDADYFDDVFVCEIDYSDNTGEYNLMSETISAFNPSWDSDQDLEDAFKEAVAFAKVVLEKNFEKIRGSQRARDIVSEKIKSATNQTLVLERFVPFKEMLAKTNNDIHFVVFPSIRGGYGVQAVGEDPTNNFAPFLFPETFRGRTADQLYKLTHIETFNFCHNSGFMASCDTLDDALALVAYVRKLKNWR